MKKTKTNLKRAATLIALATAPCVFPDVAIAALPDLPGGFQFGGSLEDARNHALSQGLKLVRISANLPDQYSIEQADGVIIGLYFCHDRLAGVNKYEPGSLDRFAALVTALRIETRQMQPDMQVVMFRAGATPISNVDVQFEQVDGVKVRVQLSSTDGRLGVSTNYAKVGACAPSSD